MPNQDPTQNPNPVSPPVDQPISPVVPPTIFPQSDLPPLVPEFQNLPKNDSPITPPVGPLGEKPAVPDASQPVGSDSGSGAPPDISSVISKPKKKFGGGKIIATILGLIVLVGGVGAGILLTQQPQLFQQKASCVNPGAGANGHYCDMDTDCCSNYCSPTTGFCATAPYVPSSAVANGQCLGPGETCATGQSYTDNSCIPTDTRCGTKPAAPPQPPSTVADGQCLGPGQSCTSGKSYSDNSCIPTDTRCGTKAAPATIADGQCLGPGETCTTGQSYTDNSCIPTDTRCGTKPAPPPLIDDPKCSGIVNGSTTLGVGSLYPTCYVNHYWCQTSKPSGCSDQLIGNAVQSASFTKDCGTEQIDLYCPLCPKTIAAAGNDVNGQLFISKVYPRECFGETQTPIPTPTTTPTGSPTASCQNILAYTSAPTWAHLTNADLSVLPASRATNVNFCVTGSASSGNFDKAKFTINGVEQAETTTVRPGSTDFCQSYTIPVMTATTAFNITAKIHHVTLGWK